MNCANHPDRERTAFCQNCGKPLCTECIRNYGSSIFCEPCLAARVNATTAPPPGYGYTAPTGYPPPGPPIPASAPNPGLAALLGFIPGVGAMYNEQYGKGIVHLIVFAILVTLSSDVNGIFGLFIAGWIFYMVIEAHHTARARRDGTPLPNPFGLNDISERLGFGKAWPGQHPNPYGTTPDPTQPAAGAAPNVPPANPYAAPYTYAPPVANWGAPQDAYSYGVPPVPPVPPVQPPALDPNLHHYRRFPSGAIWLIALGVFFLFGNVGLFHVFPGRLFGPFVLIGISVWLFVRKMTSTGQGLENDGTPNYHWRLMQAIRCAFWTMLVGVIWLLDVVHILRWRNSWPLFLIAGGIMLIFKRSFYGDYAATYPPYPGTPPVPPAPPAPTTGLVPTDHSLDHPVDGQEGR